MICRVLIEFNQKLSKNQGFKEHKLLTFRLLIIVKDQLSSFPHIVVQLNNNCNCLEEESNRIGTLLGTIAPNGAI